METFTLLRLPPSRIEQRDYIPQVSTGTVRDHITISRELAETFLSLVWQKQQIQTT